MEKLEQQLKQLLETMEEGYCYEISIIKKPIDENDGKQQDINLYKTLRAKGKSGLIDVIKFYDKDSLVKLARNVGVLKPSGKEDKLTLINKIVEKMGNTLSIGKSFR